ncbi:MAG: DNA-directed RNA polymerase subunit beta [Bacteroidetes bacterium]|nr:DNA-directed RNA polymerase subunit beta [Bacteroidota bacterium]
MATKTTPEGRITFSSVLNPLDYPDFLDIQLKSFKDFFQLETLPEHRQYDGLYRVFAENFPISDTRNNFVLEFLDYFVDPPRYSIEECIERGLTYNVPLKAKLRLSCNDKEHEDFETIEQEVYLGLIPYMTPKGTFVINGAERVIVSQLHRSPGVFFGQTLHSNGSKLYSARIIPFKGSWIEFATDVNNVMYAYIDRKKKFPVTTLLRAIGYTSDKDILNIFDLADEVKVSKAALKKVVGRRFAARVLKSWVEDFVDESTGEVQNISRNEILIERDVVLEDSMIDLIVEAGVKNIILHKEDVLIGDYSIIFNTLNKDISNSETEALNHIYKQLRNADPPDDESARQIIEKLFFSDKRYDLGEVGRYRINRKLGMETSTEVRVLTRDDIVAIVKYLIQLSNSKADVDDIDHLSNRRVRTVGEQLFAQFGVGLARMARTIRERMNIRDNEVFAPTDLINARTLSSVINSFFGTNQLSQFMDQTNPLAEITHKRRMSALGPGGLSRERAGFEVRDVHYTHYGRLCTIETPEGPNIGLISSLCTHAKVNNMGFIETPYWKVDGGKVTLSPSENKNEPGAWKAIFLSAEDEDNRTIAQASSDVDVHGHFKTNQVKARLMGDFPTVDPKAIEYMDVAPNQIVGIAASLIPFLEHDDANRALMGSNMQRQAVPLLRPEAPIVGTGLEGKVARDSRAMINAEGNGVVEYVDANSIVVRYKRSSEDRLVSFQSDVRTYNLIKFRKTNQYTCVNHKPLVRVGDHVQPGDVLVEGYATQAGELALGRNLKVAFMPWQGYNFEDAIVISERVVREDWFTSVHIEEFELQVRDTKRGEEELTADIPNVSEEATKDLDENGLIRVGAEVREGDILIGKITPKGESDPSPEEKLLRAIFGDKAGDVKDASLRVPPSMTGVVIDKKLFTRVRRDKSGKQEEKLLLERIDQDLAKEAATLRTTLVDKLMEVAEGKVSQGVFNKLGEEIIPKGVKFTRKGFNEVDYDKVNAKGWLIDKEKSELIERLHKNYMLRLSELNGEAKRRKFNIQVGDELPAGINQLAKIYVAQKRKLKVGDKMAGRHGNKGIVARIVRDEDMPFTADGKPVDIVLNPLGVPSRMNLGQIYESVLAWAGKELGVKFATPIFDGASYEEVKDYTIKAGIPELGGTQLYDGQTGMAFDQKTTVGVIYMLKLGHMVDDKMHARSIGPYSLITQQPLGGKAQFGGQRFGEMEVWALEAFGASNILQEILTYKSDDIVGRAKAYEAIVKGDPLPPANIPESFNVLLHELRGLCLDVQLD